MFHVHRKAALSIALLAGGRFIAGVGMMGVLGAPALAAEWSITPALRLGYEYNDNIRMTLQPHDSVNGTTVAPSLDMGVRSEIWGISGTAEASRKRYSGDEGLDSDNEAFRLSTHYRRERSTFNLNASRVNDTTLVEELNDPDLGLVTVQRVRTTKNVQPTWTWFMTERAQVQLSYRLTEVSYVDGESDGLYDYQWREATGTWSYWLSPRSQFFLTANYSQYRVPATTLQSITSDGTLLVQSTISSVDSRTPSYRVGISHTFSETMRGELAIGRRKTTTERETTDCLFVIFAGSLFPAGCFPDTQTTHDSGTTFSGNLKKSFEKFDITTSLSRSLAASAAATETETDALSVNVDRPISARLKSVLVAGASKAKRIAGASTTDTNIKQYSIQPGLNWQWSEEANVNLSYRYRHLKRASQDRAAQSHAAFLTFVYTWPKYSISR